MAKYGIIATESGVGVGNAPDYKQSLNSSWPVLEIALDTSFSSSLNVPATQTYRFPIATHSLGFLPALTWIDSQGFDIYGFGYSCNDSGSNVYTIVANEKQVYIQVVAISSPFSFTVTGKLLVYNYDPRTEFTADTVGSTNVETKPSSVGMIVLKDGARGSIDDHEYSKFSTHTKAKSLQIHKSGVMTVDPSGNGLITHNLGYLPSYMIFANTDTLSPGVAARTFGNANTLRFSGVQSVLAGKYAYIIFKDPILEQV